MNGEPEEVKALLGRAFGPEPPLALDRAELFRRGRQRMRVRRLAASGGVVAAVVAVVVGATVLSGLGGGAAEDAAARPLTALSTSSRPDAPATAPAGPELPLASATLMPTELNSADPPSDAHAAALTKVIARDSKIPPEFTALAVIDDGRGPLEFRPYQGAYYLIADLRDAKGVGALELAVGHSGPDGMVPGCPVAASAQADCELVQQSDVQLRVSTVRENSGYLANTVYALRADRTVVSVTSSNLASRANTGKPTSRLVPPLDLKLLRLIATQPGLSFY
ncbi:MAG: hypothetical protein ACJ72N_03515 [Labedaea sp.]